VAAQYEVIDSHTHVFESADETEAARGKTAPELERFDFAGDEADALATMERLGIRRMVLLPIRHPRAEFEALKEGGGAEPEAAMDEVRARWSRFNDWAVDMGRRHPDRFRAMVGLDPVFLGAEWARGEVERCLAGGARGIKIMPARIGVPPDDERMSVVWEEAHRHGLPVVSMCGLTPYTDVAHPSHFEAVASAYPRAKLVLAHAGMGAEAEVSALARRYPNVHVDTSSWFDQRLHPSWLNRRQGREPFTLGEAAEFLRSVGIDRVLFGTNWAIFPLDGPLQAVLDMPLSDSERTRILSENYRRVFDDPD
jgi:predicted TIM-barrel fold metal-dependent hydrolase